MIAIATRARFSVALIAATISAITASVTAFTLVHFGQTLLSHGLNHLDDLSVGSDDLLQLLDHWLHNFMDEHMGFVLGGGFLVAATSALMLLFDVQGRGLGLEGHIDGENTAGNFNVGGGLVAVGWGVDHFDVMLGMDGQLDRVRSVAGTTTITTSGTIAGSGTHAEQNGEDDELRERY